MGDSECPGGSLLQVKSIAETASLRAVFPQKPFQFLGIQAIRNIAEVHEADRARGQKPAFTEDLDAPVLI